jgi:hypothetical protein
MRIRNRWGALIAAATIAAGAISTVQLGTAAPAGAVPGLYQRASDVAPSDSRPVKIAVAYCDNGHRVVGGGGWAHDFGANQVVLTELRPFDGSTSDGFAVTAEEPASGFSGSWWLQAYAICAPQLAGHEIVEETTTTSNSTFKTEAAGCPAGKKVVGTGSKVIGRAGELGLHLSRAAGPLDISRSSARKRTSAYPGTWSLTSYAICANPIGAVTEGVLETSGDSGSHSCTSGRAHSVGGGGGLTDIGAYFLQTVFPSSDMESVLVHMTGMPPGGISVQTVCA